MTIIDCIKTRKSIRSYTGESLAAEQKRELTDYINSLPQPLGGEARISIISSQNGNESVKVGTYGVISGAKDYLVLLYNDGRLAAANAGYLFEQVILYCTEMGLGTCWLGGTFRKTGFAVQAAVKENEVMRIVSPVGYPAGKPKILDRIMRAGAGSDKRKPFEQLFFGECYGEPLTREGLFEQPLEMMRLAPSASNTQPWRAVIERNSVHFYFLKKSFLTDIDMGIGLCHFELTCKHLGLQGGYKVLADIPAVNEAVYLISWILDE